MLARTIALVGTLLITGLLAVLTIRVAIDNGIDVLVVVSLLVLALFGFGVLGALLSPPPDG